MWITRRGLGRAKLAGRRSPGPRGGRRTWCRPRPRGWCARPRSWSRWWGSHPPWQQPTREREKGKALDRQVKIMVSLAKMSAAGQRSAIGRALHTRANASGPRCVEACRAAVDACVQPGRYHDVQPRRPFLSTRRPAPHPKDAGERTRRCGDVGRDKKINAAAGSTPTPARTACVAPPSMRRSTNVRRAVTHRGVGRSQVNADHFLGADVERSARRNNAASGGFRAELLPGNVTAAAGDAGGGRGVEYSLSAHCGVRGGGGRELKRRSGDVCRDAARSADPERFRDEETKNVSPVSQMPCFFWGGGTRRTGGSFSKLSFACIGVARGAPNRIKKPPPSQRREKLSSIGTFFVTPSPNRFIHKRRRRKSVLLSEARRPGAGRRETCRHSLRSGVAVAARNLAQQRRRGEGVRGTTGTKKMCDLSLNPFRP